MNKQPQKLRNQPKTRPFLRLIFSALSLALFVSFLFTVYADSGGGSGAKTRGIDVSVHNGEIDWEHVKESGVQFAMIRMGYGSFDGKICSLDKRFRQNIEGALAAGLEVGLYFYTYAMSPEAAGREAEFALEILEEYRGKITYPIAFDIEEPAQMELGIDVLTEMAGAFCGRLRNAGWMAGIYASKYGFSVKFDLDKLNGYEIWVAQWNDLCTYSGDYSIWQYYNKGAVPGIKGDVDLNYCYADYPAKVRAKGLNGFSGAQSEEPGFKLPRAVPEFSLKPDLPKLFSLARD